MEGFCHLDTPTQNEIGRRFARAWLKMPVDAFPDISPTQVNGRPVLRVCIINHATRAEHVEGLLASILRIGRELVANGDV